MTTPHPLELIAPYLDLKIVAAEILGPHGCPAHLLPLGEAVIERRKARREAVGVRAIYNDLANMRQWAPSVFAGLLLAGLERE